MILKKSNINNNKSRKKIQNFCNNKVLNKPLCPYLDYNTSLRCVYLGTSCLNFDPKKINNFEILTVEPAITNKNVCLSIEAAITDKNKQKYFEYDEINKRCKLAQKDLNYKTCEEVVGNRNICLRYTSDIYCKWDSVNLKCLTILEDELLEIKTCNQNQNQKACIQNQKLGCFFSFDSDQCLPAPKNVNCTYFDKAGPVSPLVQ